jgi:hypothetical protein
VLPGVSMRQLQACRAGARALIFLNSFHASNGRLYSSDKSERRVPQKFIAPRTLACYRARAEKRLVAAWCARRGAPGVSWALFKKRALVRAPPEAGWRAHRD